MLTPTLPLSLSLSCFSLSLSLSILSLPTTQFALLGSKVDVIFHCGAFVHSVYPYPMLRAANVLGTIDLLRMASLRRPWPAAFHHISTLSIFPEHGATRWREDDPLDDGMVR